MFNLHDYLPDQYPEDEFVLYDLEDRYKELSRHSHEHALACIYAEGVKYANKVFEIGMDDYYELKAKYDTLLAKFSASESVGGNDAIVQKEAVAQTLGMGKVFQAR